MIPVLTAFGIVAIPVILFWPASDMFINVIPIKVFFCFYCVACLDIESYAKDKVD